MNTSEISRNQNMVMPSRGSGFTIIEVIVTVAIAAILLAVAIPSMQNLIRSSRVENESDRLVNLLVQTRHAALTAGRPSFVCRSSSAVGNSAIGAEDINCDITGLAALDWDADLIFYIQRATAITPAPNDRFDNQRLETLNTDAGERRQMADTISPRPDSNVVITANRDDFVIRFNPDGTMENSAPFRLAICEPNGNAEFGRIIEIGAAGQIRSRPIDTNDTNRDCTPTVAT